jgi:hypothetical protein
MEEKSLEVTDKALVFSTTLGSKELEKWHKQDISVTRDSFSWCYRIKFKTDENKKVITTYTKQTSIKLLLAMAILILIMIASFDYFSTHKTFSSIYPFFWFFYTIVLIIFQYLPYRKLGNTLKELGYLG